MSRLYDKTEKRRKIPPLFCFPKIIFGPYQTILSIDVCYRTIRYTANSCIISEAPSNAVDYTMSRGTPGHSHTSLLLLIAITSSLSVSTNCRNGLVSPSISKISNSHVDRKFKLVSSRVSGRRSPAAASKS